VIDRDLRRALAFIVPYWRRLVLVLLLSAFSTGLSLYLPLLSRDFFDHALIGRDLRTLIRVGALFALFSRRQLRGQCRQRPALHPRLGRHPLRHAAADVPPPAAAVAPFPTPARASAT